MYWVADMAYLGGQHDGVIFGDDPNDIVIDQENGAIVPYGDHQTLATMMIKFFKDQTKLQQLSLGAYSSSKRYSSANVWQAWQTLLTDAKKYFAQGVVR